MKIRPAIEKLEFVHACWIEGWYATGRFTDESDIDVWIDVDGRRFEDAARAFSEELNDIVAVRGSYIYNVYSQDPLLAKVLFYLDGRTDDNRVELDIQKHNRNFKFDRDKNKVIIVFDKNEVITWK